MRESLEKDETGSKLRKLMDSLRVIERYVGRGKEDGYEIQVQGREKVYRFESELQQRKRKGGRFWEECQKMGWEMIKREIEKLGGVFTI